MADKLEVDLAVAKSQLQYVNRNDWVLILDKAKLLNFKKDETLIQMGKQPAMVIVIMKGKAEVRNGFGVKIAEICPGEICGEMAFLENGKASASVVAEEPMVVYGVDWPTLQDLFELYPPLASRFYRSLAVGLSRRLRGQISRIASS
jgi:extracellular factor (EF) 3-hydroxypalmitic acid methyl ester biosynthesis protein